MKNWFKTFELPEHDVLVIRNSDNEDGEYVETMISVDCATISAKVRFDKESDCDEFFKDYDKENAIAMVRNMAELLG